MRTLHSALAVVILVVLPGVACSASEREALQIVEVAETPLFPRPAAGEELKRLVRLKIENAGAPVELSARVTSGATIAPPQNIGLVTSGVSTVTIRVPDVSQPIAGHIELLDAAGTVVTAQPHEWQPAKKWQIFCVAYSHHDLGFGNYPHRLRTEIRHANIERPLEFCRATDSWDDDSKFRFMIETSEPLTSYLGSHSSVEAAELAQRIREGRIQIGALHNTANTEQLNQELLARLFYLTNRHSRDLLQIPPSRTAQTDDVIGLTWPLATYCAEAGIPFFFHGPNLCGRCLQPADSEPVFNWRGPDNLGQVLMRSAFYGGYAGDNPGDVSEAHILKSIQTLGANWPYDALLLQEGSDFQLVTLDTATRIRAWNQHWAYPRLICATMDMFFDAIAAQVDPSTLKTLAKDSNNQWADQDANDASLLAEARRTGELIPTAEKFATLATAVAGQSYPWTDLYQAYHRLLAYHEHTNAIDGIGPQLERMRRYETELAENREMVTESRGLAEQVLQSSLSRLSESVARAASRTIVVWNPLTRQRTDIVKLRPGTLPLEATLTEVESGSPVPWQTLPDGSAIFVAAAVPALGYRTYAIDMKAVPATEPAAQPSANTLENSYYRIAFDPTTGAIKSIYDKELNKELVDSAAPYGFNEYLYERIETSNWDAPHAWHRVSQATLQASQGPVANTMTIKATAVGVESLTQTVLLYHDVRRIDFVLDLIKSPSGRRNTHTNSDPMNKESVYISLPLAVPDPQIRHALPGCVAAPVTDLFEGACTAFYAVRHFSDASGKDFGVTVSAPDSSLFEYGHPRSCPIRSGGEALFERDRTPPANSHMYLYLMNNMFDVNVRWDQPGPVQFCYSLRSHAEDWRNGKADEFGWDVLNPLLATVVDGAGQGSLPAASCSFLTIDQANVTCTTLKQAEQNGAGMIVRLVETQGRATDVRMNMRFLPRIAAAVETSLIEDDRAAPLEVDGGNVVRVSLLPFGVKTIRLTCAPAAPSIIDLQAKSVSDMEVALSWKPGPTTGGNTASETRVAQYRVYRDTKRDFQPTLLNLVQRSADPQCVDRPQLNSGGWIANRLEPETTYYYRVAAVDQWNNEGPVSDSVQVETRKTSKANAKPLPVAGLRAVLVSPISRFNAVNLMWRTNCEADVSSYEIHRSTEAGLSPGSKTLMGTVQAADLIPGSNEYGHVPHAYRTADYDHLMFLDQSVKPHTTYYYRVLPVDASGSKGDPSDEVSITTGPPDPLTELARGISAQSVFAPEYATELAIDGSSDPYFAWIAKPHGGGTAAAPQDVWWQIELPTGRSLTLQGVVIVGDNREVIPIQKSVQVEVRKDGKWEQVGTVRDATTRTLTVPFSGPVTADGLRIVVPAADLPHSDDPALDGIVRICELRLITGEGREVSFLECEEPQLIARPNIIFILADDLGINDLACYGRTDHRTPHLDQLAAEGMRFTSAYCAQPICSASRAAIMSGKHPARLHLTTFLPGRPDCPSQRLLHPEICQQLPLEEVTLAEHLHQAGYATACIGKWHLGGAGFGPLEQGFDLYVPGKGVTTPSETEGGKGEYELTRKADEFITAHRDGPFFLYLAHDTPHIPYSARAATVAANQSAFEPVYAALIETMDDTVGRLLQRLNELGIADNTIVVFTSDNGGLHVPELKHERITHNTPFRAGKGFLYEGGLRVPAIVRWPGHVPTDQVIDEPIVNTDWLPTLLACAGLPEPNDVDGVNLHGLLTGQFTAPQRPLVWHFPHYTNQGSRPAGAIRDGVWKLIEYYDDPQRIELYNLAEDVGEQQNVADREPDRVQAMRSRLVTYCDAMQVQRNLPNPTCDEKAFEALYETVDPSLFNPLTASAEQWARIIAWRAQMDAVVPRKK